MQDKSFTALALIVSAKMTLTWKLDKSQLTVKSKSRLKFERRVDFNSTRFMQDTSFTALALIVSANMT